MEMGKPDRQGSRRALLAGVTLPIPPTINHYWKHAARWSPEQQRSIVTVYTTAEGKAYAQALRNLMLERKAWYYSEEPLHLRVLICFDNDRVQEVDNRIKPLQDALAFAGVYKNDKQVKIVEARQGPKLKPPCCIVWLDEFVPDTHANLRWIQNPVG